MINELLDRLRGAKVKPGNQKPKADPALNQIYLQLHQSQRSRSFIEVTVKGDDVVYQSLILAIDPEERTLLIDELFPTGFVGMPGQAVNVCIRQSGGKKLKFNSMIMEHHLHDNAPIYVLAMPDMLESDQRRNAYRLPIGEKLAIHSHFVTPGHQHYQATLRNVSSSGIAMEVLVEDVEHFSHDLHYDDHLRDFAFDFAGLNIDCELAVRNVEVADAGDKKVMIGAEFIDLPALEKKNLERSIMRIQRDRIRYSGQLASEMALS